MTEKAGRCRFTLDPWPRAESKASISRCLASTGGNSHDEEQHDRAGESNEYSANVTSKGITGSLLKKVPADRSDQADDDVPDPSPRSRAGDHRSGAGTDNEPDDQPE